MSNISRQFGVHELPGTEEPAPQPKRETVSAGFETQMRGYVAAIWDKIAALEGKVDRVMTSQGRPLLVSDEGGGGGGGEVRRRVRPETAGSARLPPKPSTAKPSTAKPWEVEGVSRRTWYRRHKEAQP
jgi:hypothetical protein